MPEQIPEPAVTVTLTEMYHEFRSLRDEVKHLSAVMDPTLAEIRQNISDNASQIKVITSERKAADEALELRIRALETAGYVTGPRMWTAVGVLAAVVAALVAMYVVIR